MTGASTLRKSSTRPKAVSHTEDHNRILHSENLAALRSLPDASVQLIYIDPPFNTGATQRRPQIKTIRDEAGDRTGFGGRRYRTEPVIAALHAYTDTFDDYLGFLRPRLIEAVRLLTPTGSMFVHIDPREVHYVKVLLDELFTTPTHSGRSCFQNEIIWSYDYGARPSRRWPAKHDNILWYTRHPSNYTFNLEASDRIPYMAPKLVGADKAARGKTPTDVWWHTIVSPTGKEKTGYPTQKPLGILERIIRVHSNPGDTVLDFFAGSGTTGVAAVRNHRNYILVDENPEAIAVIQQRLGIATKA
jgi:site-specific DNA-methyltransferase (adenine-specific)